MTVTDMKKETLCLFFKTRWNKDVRGMRLDDALKEKLNRETVGDNSSIQDK